MSARALAARIAAELADGAEPAAFGAALDAVNAAAQRLLAADGSPEDLNTFARAVAAEAVVTVLNVLADADGWSLVDASGAPIDGLHEAFLEAIAHAPA